MTDYREEYKTAREQVAQILQDQFGLKLSFKDNNRLTLEGGKYCVHFTFYIPDGDGVSITEKGADLRFARTFIDYLFDQYPIKQ